MSLSKNKLYLLLSVTCCIGILWSYYSLWKATSDSHTMGVCLIKQVIHVPCPSCGSTRAVIALMQGDFLSSLLINPLGMLLAVIMLLVPCWVVVDLCAKNDSLLKAYLRMEQVLRKPPIAIVLIVLVLINWLWNITKGL